MELDKIYINTLQSLKDKIRQIRQKTSIAVNRQMLVMYWEIGNAILLQQKQEGWGTKVIDRLAADLKAEFPDFKGLSVRNLKYMRSFAEAWPDFTIVQPMDAQLQAAESQQNIFVQPLVAQIPWAHHIVILNKTSSQEERIFYLRQAAKNGWSKSVLAMQVDSQLHLRQGNAITNFELTLPKVQSDLARETLKNPYIFDFLGLGEEIQERELEKALIQHMKKFMLELGRGFAYVGNQYNLVVEGDDYFLDLLFYNYHLHCFVVFELKVGEFKPEFAGKLNFYTNTINLQIRGVEDNPTIGVLLCKTPNKTVIEYSLKGINSPLGVADYELTQSLPKQLKAEMPTIEELAMEIEKEAEEFKEKLNPVDARLRAVKERLKAVDGEEIKTPATYEILQSLFKDGLKPMYRQIMQKLFIEFNDDVMSETLSWTFNRQVIYGIDEMEELWKKEDLLKSNKDLEFNYQLHGFKKSGPHDFDEYLRLRFVFDTYWYGFYFANNNEPVFKKMYHQPITEQDIKQIEDLMVMQVLDRIEWIIERMKNNL